MPSLPISVGRASAWSQTVKQQRDRFQSQAPPMLVHKYVDENGSTAMLDTKRSAGVRAVVNVREGTSCMLLPSVNMAAEYPLTRK